MIQVKTGTMFANTSGKFLDELRESYEVRVDDTVMFSVLKAIAEQKATDVIEDFNVIVTGIVNMVNRDIITKSTAKMMIEGAASTLGIKP